MGIEIGQTISHYKILRKLGHGGMGDVYLAENTRLGLKVALKFLASQLTRDEKAIKRLEHEARAVAELSHPNISRIYDIEKADGHRFLVLEYLEGETLSDRIQRGPLPIEETIRIGKAIAEGLVHAHARGIVHRDIKAPNVMLTADGGVKIMDFGLAHMPNATRLTESGEWLGTVPNMSPEQASGTAADERSDLWSLGVVLYQCITGRFPFEGDSAMAVIGQIRSDPVTPPTALRTGVPIDLDRVVLRCLEKAPTLRYQTANDLLAELRRLEGSDASSISDATTIANSSQSREKPNSSRRRAALLLVAAVVIVAAVTRPWERNDTVEPDRTAKILPDSERPNWIIVADFEGPEDDPGVASAVRELVVASLTYSNVVTPMSREQMARALELAAQPDTSEITGTVARELAVRVGARTYLMGRVDRLLQGHSLVLHVKDSETGALVHSVTGTSASTEVLISTLVGLCDKLRVDLGEKAGALGALHDIGEVITPSFDAYRHYKTGIDLHNKGRDRESIPEFRKALMRDQDFAYAWLELGEKYLNIGERDSAIAAFTEAKQRPTRLLERDRAYPDASLAHARADYAAALRHYDALVQHIPADPKRHSGKDGLYVSNRATILMSLGRFEEALDGYLRLAKGPGKNQAYIGQMTRCLIRVGQLSEANDWAQKLTPNLSASYSIVIAMARSDWAGAERQANEVLNDTRLRGVPHRIANLARASVLASRGSVDSAMAILDRDARHSSCYMRHQLALVTGSSANVSCASNAGGNRVLNLVMRGICGALRDEKAVADSALAALLAESEIGRRRQFIEIRELEARTAALDSRWEDAIRLVKPGDLRLRTDIGVRWFLAELYEHLGHSEVAALQFESVTSPIALGDLSLIYRGIFYPFAHHRLALLYSKMGRVEDARRHWEIFEKTFTNPDPELVPMVEEARRALEEAEARAGA